ncbi:MAG TPA: EXLDI protein [Candidatus Saccharimonadales bacterium]|nr:EXLDI protein [Candidatus Saccharimonadales bacterium]
MGNKTIYVSEKDEVLFNRAKDIAGEALSSVIARALREYVTRNEEKGKGMKEITVKVGQHDSAREQRFVGQEIGKWSGFSDDKVWWMSAKIYKTQKGNWAILLTHVSKATLLISPTDWKAKEYLDHTSKTELIVGESLKAIEKKLPQKLFSTLEDLSKKYENPVEYLDI